jgi:hypothetical protein
MLYQQAIYDLDKVVAQTQMSSTYREHMGCAVDEQSQGYAVGYGQPPVETRFQKGQSGNPGGRRRGTRTLAALLGEALSRRSGFPNSDGSWMTQAEAIFAVLVGQAAGSDLKAKRLLFDVLVKLQRADICWAHDRLPEIQLDESEGDARAEVAAEIDQLAEAMGRETAARSQASREWPGGGRDE